MGEDNLAFIVPLVVGGVFVLLGLIFIFIALRTRRQAAKSALWPVVPGNIVDSHLKEHRHYNNRNHRTSYTYEPQVEYTYSVMEMTYTGNKIGYGVSSYDRGNAQNFLDRYPVGAEIQVHYNPENLREAVIETSSGGKGLLILAAIFLVLGLAGCVLSFTLIILQAK